MTAPAPGPEPGARGVSLAMASERDDGSYGERGMREFVSADSVAADRQRRVRRLMLPVSAVRKGCESGRTGRECVPGPFSSLGAGSEQRPAVDRLDDHHESEKKDRSRGSSSSESVSARGGPAAAGQQKELR